MKIELKKGETFDRFITKELEPYAISTSRDGTGAVVALVGELGAGKSTLTRHLAKYLGVDQKLPSPTFLLMKEYDISPALWGKKRLVHIDAYRIQKVEELTDLGIDTLFRDVETLSVIEWADRVEQIIPLHAAWFSMKTIGENERSIERVKRS